MEDLFNLYNYSDFTLSHYRELIRIAKKKYTFSQYHSFDKGSNFVLWRHDVDFSPHRALRLAEIENEEKVKATYFFLLHSDFYNIFELENVKIVNRIIELGHDIGVHFDPSFYNITQQEEIETHLRWEKDILTRLFKKEIFVFSFHNTTPFIMGCKEWTYADLINTYATYFQESIEYCSDSNGYWKYKRLFDLLSSPGSPKELQVLTHPEWWQDEPMSPWERIKRCAEGRQQKVVTNYRLLLNTYAKKNIGDNE